jgi:hypothetical protein
MVQALFESDSSRQPFCNNLATSGDGAAASGPVIARGGGFGGWVLCVNNGKPACNYNFLNI